MAERAPMFSLAELREIMARLRDPQGGCPWDLKQDFKTIAPYTIEEAYEVADAIAHEDADHLREELGDLLFQVVYHTQMAEEANLFRFEDVLQGICEKMIRRHPHVFGDDHAATEEQVRERWEEIKASENAARLEDKNADTSYLAGISAGMAPLQRAVKLQRKAARVGFDWQRVEDVWTKCKEELEELDHALAEQQPDEIREELGDLLFSLINLSRHLDLDGEMLLIDSNQKFERRFRAMEALANGKGKRLNQTTPQELEALWQAVKLAET